MSIGLLAENYWIGLSSPYAVRGLPEKLHSPRVAWLRATDRAYSMAAAMQVHAKGIQVDSYGVGSVTLDIPNGNTEEAIEIAGAAGLYPPHHLPEDAYTQRDLS